MNKNLLSELSTIKNAFKNIHIQRIHPDDNGVDFIRKQRSMTDEEEKVYINILKKGSHKTGVNYFK